MILLTVGTQLPFDRLVRAVDRVAPNLSQPVCAQIGKSTLRPENLDWEQEIEPNRFEEMFKTASLIIAHAGIGTVLMAQRHQRPLILFPRRAELHEHRNDHQLATVTALQGRKGIEVALTEERLAELLIEMPSRPTMAIESPRRTQLTEAIRNFLANP